MDQALTGQAGSLSGRVALVTGAASGIGRVVASRLAEHGTTTIFADINHDEATVAASQAPGRAEARGLNVADPDEWAAAIAAISSTHGQLDILVNCAGVYSVCSTSEMTFQEWSRVIDINLSSVFYSLKFATPLMSKGSDAMVINIASALGMRARELMSAYAASKAGVISLTRSAAKEFAHHGLGVRVNAICPGPTETPILDTLGAERLTALGGAEAIRERVMQTIPLGRFGLPDDIAEAVLFLVSDRAKFVTGSCFVVDGGQSA